MALSRKLLPIAGPLAIAAVLAVVSGSDEDAKVDELPPAYTEHPREPVPPPVAEPAPPPRPVVPVDRPRCMASMTVRELGRQLMMLGQVERIATLYREDAPPEVARAYLQSLADSATALSPGVARSRVLVIAAEGLVQLGHGPAARVALQASRELPPPLPTDYGFERTAWRGQAARVAARLDDHALAQTLLAEDHQAQATLARHYAEVSDEPRARALLEAEPELAGLGWRLDEAGALAGLGELRAALALADAHPEDAALVRLQLARTLTRLKRPEQAVEVLRGALERLPSAARPGARLSTLVAVARGLDDAGDPVGAQRSFEQVRGELQALGDHFQALEPWAALIDAEHHAGRTVQAWSDIEGLEAVGLANMQAAPLTRVLLLAREGRLDEALEVIHATAGMSYPIAYAQIHVRMREPSPQLERELDRGLRMFCSDD